MRTDILYRKDEILAWIEEELTITEMKTRLCCKAETLQRYLKKMGIDYKGQQARKGQHKGPNVYKDSSYYTYKGGPAITSAKLREKLIRDGIKEAKCEKCDNTHWLGVPLPLELHHKNGDHFDNELDNLEILCPNCHSISNDPAIVYAERYKRSTEKQLITKALKEKNSIEAKARRKAEKQEKLAADKQSRFEAKLAAGFVPDRIGRFNTNILGEDVWLARKDLILNSGVALSEFGWKTELQKVTGLTRRQVDLTINHFYNDFKDIIYIRN